MRRECTVIAGCGRLGASIAGKLSEQKQDVLVVDIDKSAFRKLPCSYGGMTLMMSATDIEKMKAAGLDKAETFLSVTDNDCVNICAAQIAKEVFQIPKVVARVYDEEKIELVKELGIEVICPVELSERVIAQYMGGTEHVEEK